MPPLPAATIAQQPVMSVAYLLGNCQGSAFLQLDTMPVMSREPEAVPNIPGGGFSYNHFMEYLSMGIRPTAGTGLASWSGRGVSSWTVKIDGVAYGGGTINFYDGTPGPIGFEIQQFYGPFDWTVAHTWQLTATYHDRPSYEEFWIDPSTVGIVAFGPGTMLADPNVPWTLEGIGFGCCSRHAAFFPSAFWGDNGYWDPWVDAHHNVGDPNGPVDRYGRYLGLSGPWGSAVPKQHLATGPGLVVCGGACQPASLPDQPGGSGDVYATALFDFVNTTTYPEVTYTVSTPAVTLPACTFTSSPVFDVTRAHKLHN